MVGVGGSLRSGSTTEAVLRYALDRASDEGARVRLVAGEDLVLPPYQPGRRDAEGGAAFIGAVREADGLIIASPGYHGTVSGLTKNALDYLEELRGDDPPYLTGRPVGCVATAFGWQAAVTTLVTLRQVVHALRGWPSPLGVAINMADHPLDADGNLVEDRARELLSTVAAEVCGFALARAAGTSSEESQTA
ncbi:MAG: FMN reductase [Gemmatimonas sp.]|nr:FMN reductase [Gemmatimonas sp.]